MSHELLRNHPSIVRLQGITWNQLNDPLSKDIVTTPVLVVELASLRNGKPLTLESYILGGIDERPNLELKAKLLAEVASDLHALHSLGVVHGDMKPSNVLLFQSGQSYVAKISDFGFCIAGDDNVEPALGGTAFWSPPECFPDAPAAIRPYRTLPTRDFYSFGLVTWFVLFEEIPFGGSERALASTKAAESLKDEIDKRFESQFRTVFIQHEVEIAIDANQPGEKMARKEQEQWDMQFFSWVSCQDNHQHILRFLMQWVLVKDPESRRSTFDLYLNLLTEETWLEIAKASFEEDGRWDREWREYGRPPNRLKSGALAALSKTPPNSLYSVEAHRKLLDWGALRNYETYGDDYSSSEVIASQIPLELQQEIFRLTSNMVTVSEPGKALQQQRLLASCYRTGFGVQQSISHAIEWYQKAAVGGDSAAAQALLQLYGIEQAKERLSENQYCQLVTQVLLAQFVPDMQVDDKRELMKSRIATLSRYLCHDPTIAILPLQRALEAYLQTATSSKDDLMEPISDNAPPGWSKLRRAVEEDDTASLRKVFVDFPTSNKLRVDSVNMLLQYAVKLGRAGMVWTLVNELGADPKSEDSSGLTPLRHALRLGKTTVVRVLLFSGQSPAIEGSLIALDAAAEGEASECTWICVNSSGFVTDHS
jgi:serine/threonine protein kinase